MSQPAKAELGRPYSWVKATYPKTKTNYGLYSTFKNSVELRLTLTKSGR